MNLNELFAPLFEFFYYTVPFSDDLFAEGLYSTLVMCDFFISLLLVIIFYRKQRPKYSQRIHWFVFLILNFIVAYTLGVILPQAKFDSLGLEYHSEYYIFALDNGAVSTMFFLFNSIIICWFPGDAKGTPFYQ